MSWRGGPTIFAPLDCSAGEVVPWNELWRDSELIDLGDDVRIASIPHLIQLERLADRPEDRVDIEALTAILEAKAPR